MYTQIILVIILFISQVLSFPFDTSSLIDGENKLTEPSTDLPANENPQELNEAVIRNPAIPAAQKQEPKDLMGQEAFYPAGVWWGFRPWGGWGGWGGYRPWHGWHEWHGPHWGGQWGGHWGNHWGGGRWGRASS